MSNIVLKPQDVEHIVSRSIESFTSKKVEQLTKEQLQDILYTAIYDSISEYHKLQNK